MKFLIIIAVFSCVSQFALSQPNVVHQPMSVYDEQSYDLIKRINTSGKQMIEDLDKSEKELEMYISNVTQELVDLVSNEKIINNPSLDKYLNDIIYKLVNANNISMPTNVFILKSEKVNAFSLGDGTLLVCNGLIARFDREEELAFVLAHELAHWELEHFKKKVLQHQEVTDQYKPQKEIKKFNKGKVSFDGIRKIKSWHYDRRRFSREMETEADSIGFDYFARAYGNKSLAVSALQKLDSGLTFHKEYGARLFRHLNFKAYPFKKEWVDEPDKGYQDPSNYRAFDADSSMTHPDMEKRISKLLDRLGTEGELSTQKDHVYLKIRDRSKFENLSAAFANGRLDQLIYLSLRLKENYPNNSFVSEMLVAGLLEIYELKRTDQFYLYEPNTLEYNREQQYVDNFIQNIRAGQAAALAFHYMNKKGNFDPNDQEHYLLLYRATKAMNQRELQKQVRKSYLTRFDSPFYQTEIMN